MPLGCSFIWMDVNPRDHCWGLDRDIEFARLEYSESEQRGLIESGQLGASF